MTSSPRLFGRTLALRIRPGDVLTPDPLWDRTEWYRKLGLRVEVLGVRHEQCETGVMVQVKTQRGQTIWLSAGWFLAGGVLL